MKPGITLVITTVEPRRPLLARALQSVWAQTVQPEVVVIAQDVERRGAAYNRQVGTDAVATELVAYLDDDDELYPDHLEILAGALETTEADLVYPWFDVIGGTDPFPHHEGLPWTNEEPVQVPVTFLARTEAIRAAGGWTEGWSAVDVEDPGTDPEGNRAGEDWRLTLRLIQRGFKIVHHRCRTWAWHHDSGNSMGLPSRIQW